MPDKPANATPPPCPKCNSREIVPVIYGLPSYDDLASLRRQYGHGGFVLGGCIVGDSDSDWCCKSCGAMFSDEQVLDTMTADGRPRPQPITTEEFLEAINDPQTAESLEAMYKAFQEQDSEKRKQRIREVLERAHSRSSSKKR